MPGSNVWRIPNRSSNLYWRPSATPPPSSPTPLLPLPPLPSGQALGNLRRVAAVGRLVVRLVHAEVVLGHVPPFAVVGVLVARAVTEFLRSEVASVPQVLRDRDRSPVLHVLAGRTDRRRRR